MINCYKKYFYTPIELSGKETVQSVLAMIVNFFAALILFGNILMFIVWDYSPEFARANITVFILYLTTHYRYE